MSLVIEPGSVTLTNTAGDVILNTTEKMFYLRSAERLTQTVVIPQRITTGGLAGTASYAIGTVDAAATFLRGRMRITGYVGTDGQQSVAVDTYVNISGTYVHLQSTSLFQGFTLIKSGTTVTMEEQYYAKQLSTATGQIYSMLGFTMSLELLWGQFT